MEFTHHYKDNRGEDWAIDPVGIRRLLRAEVYATSVLQRSRQEFLEKHWLGPDIIVLNTNWDGLSKQIEFETRSLQDDLDKQFKSKDSGEAVFSHLVGLRQKAISVSDKLRNMQLDATNETMQNVQSSISKGQMGENAARFVRDAAGEVLVACAASMTGGAALTAMGAASVYKGSMKFVDTQNVGATLLEASSTMIVGTLDIGGTALKLKGAGKWTLTVVSAQIDGVYGFAQAMIEGNGKNVKQAAKAAGAKIGMDLFADKALQTMLAKAAIPALVHLRHAPKQVLEISRKSLSAVGGNKVGDMLKGELDPSHGAEDSWKDAPPVISITEHKSSKHFVEQTAMRRLQ